MKIDKYIIVTKLIDNILQYIMLITHPCLSSASKTSCYFHFPPEAVPSRDYLEKWLVLSNYLHTTEA